MIASGDHWLDAWTMQSTVTWQLLAQRARLSVERIAAMRRQSNPSADEIARLASVWQCPPADVAASIEFNDAQFISLPRLSVGTRP